MDIDVAMACYQGAKFIDQQIDSIMRQQHVSLTLWIRDDGSTDGSVELIAKWQQRFPRSIRVIPGGVNLGVVANFSQLLAHTRARYILLADQDDCWFPDKVAQSIAMLKQLENKWGGAMPILLHSDLCVVDRSLQRISQSFWKYSNIDPNKTALNHLLMQNVVTGCTVAINRPLLELAMPISRDALMHDWWLALVASAFGVVGHITSPTLLYRQHGSNDTGAKRYSIAAHFKGNNILHPRRREKSHLKQAEAFLERYHACLLRQPHLHLLLKAMGELGHLPFIAQKKLLIRHRLFKHGLLRNIKLFMLRAKN